MINFNGVQLKVVTRWDNIYKYDVEVEKYNNGSSVRAVGGYAFYIFKELSEQFNFSFKLCPEVKTFDFDKATEYGIDIYMGSFSLYEARAKIADHTFVIGNSKIVALINHNFETEAKFDYFQPFERTLWYTVIAFACLTCISLWILGVIETSKRRDRLFHGLAILLQKSTDLNFVKYNSRAIVWIMMIAVTVIMTCYNGAMVSLIAVKHYRIRSLESLLTSSFDILLERGYNNGSTIQAIAETLKDSMSQMNTLLQKAKKSSFIYESFDKSIEKVLKSPSAYLIDEETAFISVENTIGHMPCEWSLISVAGIHYPWSMFVQKKSPYKAAINLGILRLDERGLLARARSYWIPKLHDKCERATSLNDSGVPIDHIYFVYLLYGSGVLISIALCIFERNKHTIFTT